MPKKLRDTEDEPITVNDGVERQYWCDGCKKHWTSTEQVCPDCGDHYAKGI